MRNSVKAVIKRLNEIVETVETSISNEESRDYPNEDRLADLEAELNCIENAIASLEEIE